jgi:N utilization substance protein B
MGYRRKSREIVIQVLYALTYIEDETSEFKHLDYINHYKEILEDLIIEEDIKFEGNIYLFSEESIKNIICKMDVLDEYIVANIGVYKLEKIGLLELIILRLAIYEMIYLKTPAPVMINEAVEIAKKFCAEKSPALINAILDKFKLKEVDNV